MAQIVCSKSGIVFRCEYMPLSLTSISHPLFAVPKKRLISLAAQWQAGRLSPEENYLLYLSLLDSTELIIWRQHAAYHARTPQIIANNMESLIHIIGKIDVITHPGFVLPKFAISPDTASLENSYHWIQVWIQQYNEWYDGLRTSAERDEIKERIDTRESALQKLLKSAHKTEDDFAPMLAKWAEDAASFPLFEISHPLTKQTVAIADYWKQIIRACAKEESIWNYPASDIAELIDHCADNVTLGSIYSNALMTLLRKGAQRRADYLGFGDADLGGRKSTVFTVLDANTSAEDANKLAAMQSAPEAEPKPQSYPNRFAYLRAKANWDMAMRYAANGGKL